MLSHFQRLRAARVTHYHIRWADSKVDWQAFQTRDEAITEAERLKRREENYSIEERDGNCERCLSLNPNARLVGGCKDSLDRQAFPVRRK